MIYLSLNLPLFLTLTRLILSPFLVPLLFSLLIPLNSFGINCSLALLFFSLSLTDFFDGFLARRYKQVTILGSLLDPIADKFLLFSTLVTLVYVGKIFFYWAILFIAREFFIMGLRHVSLAQGFKIPVVYTAKLKTCLQVMYITFSIINPNADYIINKSSWNVIEGLLLLASFGLSIYSAVQYCNYFMKKMRTLDEI